MGQIGQQKEYDDRYEEKKDIGESVVSSAACAMTIPSIYLAFSVNLSLNMCAWICPRHNW